MIEGVSEKFGVSGWDYYPKRLFNDTGAMIVPMVIGLIALWRRGWPIWVSVALGLLALQIPGHKEWRFILWVMPFGIIGLGWAAVRLEAALRPRLWLWTLGMGLAGVWLTAVFWLHLLHQYDVYASKPSFKERYGALRSIRDDPGLTGLVIATSNEPWLYWGGYHQLGRPVPIYYPGPHGTRDLETSGIEMEHVSHIIASRGLAFEGYERIGETVSHEIWRAKAPTDPFGDQFHKFEVFSREFYDALEKRPRGVRFPPLPERFPAVDAN